MATSRDHVTLPRRMTAGRLAGPLLVVAGLLAVGAAPAEAFSSGTTNASIGPGGCNACHTGVAHVGTTVSISGPSAVPAGNTASFVATLKTGAPRAGFNLSASAGTLTPGTNSKVVERQLTHFQPTPAAGGAVTWPFTWAAPATTGTYVFSTCAHPVNHDGGLTGDGPTVCATLQVSVAAATPGQPQVVPRPGPAQPRPSTPSGTVKACKSALRVSVSADPTQFSPSDEKPGTTTTSLPLQGSSAKGNLVQCDYASLSRDVTAVYTYACKEATRVTAPVHAYRCG